MNDTRMLSEEQLESAWITLRIISNAPSGKQAKASIKGHIAAQAEQLEKAEELNANWEAILIEELVASRDIDEVLGVDQSRVEDGVTLQREHLRCAKALVAERAALAEMLKKAEAKLSELWRRNRVGAADIDKQRTAWVELKAERDAQAKLVEKYRRDLLGQQDEVDDVKAELTVRAERIASLEEVAEWLRLLKGRFIEDKINRIITIDLAEIYQASPAAYGLMVEHFTEKPPALGRKGEPDG